MPMSTDAKVATAMGLGSIFAGLFGAKKAANAEGTRPLPSKRNGDKFSCHLRRRPNCRRRELEDPGC